MIRPLMKVISHNTRCYRVSQKSVLQRAIAITLGVVVVALVLVDDVLLLWLSRLLWLRGLNSLLWLMRGTSGCKLPNSKTTSSALMGDTVNLSHLQF
jgi:hypothetical protein